MTKTPLETGAGHDQDLESSSPATSTRKETRRVCSVWACFGWRGGDEAIAEGDGCSTWLDGAPPQAVVGAWRTLDLVLILVVLGCAISTGRVDGVTRVVVHAIQVGKEVSGVSRRRHGSSSASFATGRPNP